jgi:hypothetical protein
MMFRDTKSKVEFGLTPLDNAAHAEDDENDQNMFGCNGALRFRIARLWSGQLQARSNCDNVRSGCPDR